MGLVFSNYKISHAMSMLRGAPNTEQLVAEHVAFVLSIMPRGTVHVSTTEETIYGLYVPFLIAFEHPAFEDGTTIQIDFERDFYLQPEDQRVMELSIFTGIKYFKPDGSLRYA